MMEWGLGMGMCPFPNCFWIFDIKMVQSLKTFLYPDEQVATDEGRLAQSTYFHQDKKKRFLGPGEK